MHLNYRIQCIKILENDKQRSAVYQIAYTRKGSEFVPKIVEINAAKTNTSRN